MSPQEECQMIMADALRKCRRIGYAPLFRWGPLPGNKHKSGMAINIADIEGWLELPLDMRSID